MKPKAIFEIDGKKYVLVTLEDYQTSEEAKKTPPVEVVLGKVPAEALKAAGYLNLAQLVGVAEATLLRVPGFGRKYLVYVREALTDYYGKNMLTTT